MKNSRTFGFLGYSAKLTAVLLAFLIILTPLAPAFAAEESAPASTDASASDTTASPEVAAPSQDSDATAESPEADAKVKDDKDAAKEDTEAAKEKDKDEDKDKDKKDKGDEEEDPDAQSRLASTPTSLDQAKVSNSSRVSIDVDHVTGALIYKYALALPAGRNNMTPALDLVYNDEDKDNGSIFGFGWSLDIPKIQRVNKRGTDILYSNNDYSSSLSGGLKNISGSNYGAKVDDGSMLAYSLSSSIWTVTAKDGTVYTFGGVSDARLADPSDSSKIFTWYLTKVQDTNDNFISYTYYKDTTNNAVYPSTVTYTNNGANTGIYEVAFTRADRGDDYISYATGFKNKIVKRISEIQVKTNSSWTRKYALAYVAGDNGARSMLDAITESGRDEASTTTALPDMSVDYTAGGNSLAYDENIDYPTVTWTDTNSQQQTTPFTFSDQYIRVMDVNGDGLKDIVKSYNTQINNVDYPIFWVLKNNGHGWAVDSNWTQPTYSFVDGNSNTISGKFIFTTQVDVGDWNGDAKDDLIRFWREDIGGGNSLQHAVVLLNNGSGWTQDNTVTTDVPTYTDQNNNQAEINIESGSSTTNYFMDLNGDGLLDYIHAANSQINGVDYPRFAVLYNQNGNLEWDNTVSVPWVTYTSSGNTVNTPLSLSSSVKILDVNGDGLSDFLWANNFQTNGVDQPSFWVLINNGHGWTQDTTITHPTATSLDVNGDPVTSYFITTSAGWRAMDINGDHLHDWVKLWTLNGPGGTTLERKAVLVNNGHGWTQNDSMFTVGQYEYLDTNNDPQVGYPTTGTSSTTFFFDYDGDGMDDIVNCQYLESGGNYYPRHWLMENTGSEANLMDDVTLPEGGSYAFTYKSSTAYTDGSGNLLNPNLPANYNTVNTVVSDDGAGHTATTTYEYANGNYYYNDEYDRTFAGYGKITVTDPAGHKSIDYYHVGNGLQSGETGSDPTDGSFIGKVWRQQRYNSSSTLMADTYTDWTGYDLGNGRDFVYPSKIVADEDGKQTAQEFTFSTSTGNLTSEVNWGKVTPSTNTFTDTGSDKRTINYTYTTSGPIKIATVETLDQSSNRINQSKFYYDSQSLGTATDGNQTKVESWVTGSTYINSQKSYTSKGLVATETDPRSKVTTYTYDSYDMYPATVTNELDQDTDYTYNYGVGKAKQVTDANGFVYQTTFDGLGRIKEEKIPGDSSPYTPVTKSSYSYTDTANAFAIHKTDSLDGSAAAESYQYLDGFGRPIQDRVEMEDSGSYAVRDVVYNNLGLLDKESMPYTSSGSSKTTATSTASLYTTYAYDALGRSTGVTNNIGTISTAYDDWKTTVTDLRSKTKDLYSDAHGNLVQVDEHNSSNTYTTTYEYNGNNKLTKITDALSNTRNFTYDGLGRRLTAEDLHASGDTSFGSWTYTYDNAGNLSSVVDPKSQTTNYTYDDLNRVITEDYTGNAGTEVSYTYDSCTNGVGKLCSVSAPGASDSYVYNSHGNLSSQTKTINSTNYQTDFTYDRQGNQLEITNPDSSKVKYTYNTAGQLETVQRKESTDGSFINLVTDIDYGPHGKITYQAYTNGAATTNTYDSTKLYRLSTKVTTITGGSKMQDLAYTYDNNGNITRIVDASNTNSSKTADYTYDDLNRLLSATITSVASGQSTYTHNYTYNAIGDILTRTDAAGSYTYAGSSGNNYANPHAVTSVGSINYTYDNNGNILTETSGLSNTWDYNNRLTQAVKGGVTSTYAYDYSGQRVKLANGTTTRYYPTKGYDTDGTTPIKHVYAGDQLVATVKGTGGSAAVYSVHTDHLTGSNVVTNSGGTQEELFDYFPFGNIRLDQKAGTFGDTHQFAGSILDTDTGMNYMNARYYHSAIGRFASEDSAFLAIGDNGRIKQITKQELQQYLSDPQNLNSYTYARNNPLYYIDPTGQAWNPFDKINAKWFVKVGDVANKYAKYDPVFNYATNHVWVGYAAGGVGIAAGGTAAVLYGLAYAGVTSVGYTCIMYCDKFVQQSQVIGQTPTVRDALLNSAQDPKLKNIVDQLYRKTATVGDGGTADALRYETQTGDLLSKSGHYQKAVDRINELTKFLQRDNVSQQDRDIAQSLLNNLKDAVNQAKK